MLRRISLASWILIAGVLGIALGFLSPDVAKRLEIVSNIFLRLIKSIVAPVLFGVLVRALAGAGSLKELGRLGWKSLLYFESSTTIALLMGWFSVVMFQPGVSVALPAGDVPRAMAMEPGSILENAFPSSIFDALARGDVLQIVLFCILFGIACNAIGAKARPVVAFAESIAEIAFGYTRYVMLLAPFAVGSAMAVTVAEGGAGNLKALLRFVTLAYIVQTAFLVFVIGGALLLARVPLRRFAQYARDPFLVAFATTSSAAALPSTLENMERFGVPKRILGSVAPLSLSLNLTGSTIHLAMATLFVAQAAGIQLSMETQIAILLTLKLTSKGVAGIPRANLVILAALFESFGLPLSGLTLLIGVDAFIDMIRTSVNVMGHCAAGPVIAAWEGER